MGKWGETVEWKCPQCGTRESLRPSEASRKKFCSRQCASASKPRRPERKCQHCGKMFRPKASNRRTYCSRDCSFAAKAKQAEQHNQDKKKPTRQCGHCGKDCENARATYCSDACRKAVARKKQRCREKTQVGQKKYKCRTCASWFVVPYGRKTRQYCSEQCKWDSEPARRKREKHLSKLKKDIDLRREHERKRRKWLSNGPGLTLTPAQVFERDNWCCYICGDAVDPYATVPDHRAPTVDHVIALSAGGEHSDDNVRCSHFICNVRKSSETAEKARGMVINRPPP